MVHAITRDDVHKLKQICAYTTLLSFDYFISLVKVKIEQFYNFQSKPNRPSRMASWRHGAFQLEGGSVSGETFNRQLKGEEEMEEGHK